VKVCKRRESALDCEVILVRCKNVQKREGKEKRKAKKAMTQKENFRRRQKGDVSLWLVTPEFIDCVYS